MAQLHLEGYIGEDADSNVAIGTSWNSKHTYLTDRSVGEQIFKFSRNEKVGISYETERNLGTKDTVIDNASIRIYTSKEPCTLEEAQDRLIKEIYGLCEMHGENAGYSEFTILGFDVETLTFGGHDLTKILKSHMSEYCHLIIEA